MVLKACVVIATLISSIYGGDVDVDYYYGSGLRTRTVSCQSRLSHFYCQMKCDMKPAICIEDECYCMSLVPAQVTSPEIKSMPVQSEKLENEKFTKDLVGNEDLKQPETPPNQSLIESLFALRPTVRHHIAHFCPNLDVARTCIRKCMAIGKPAFCGKDHVCYCGHKYTHTAKDKGGDAKEIYAQFKDLYEKYFGPGYNKGSVEV